MSSCCSNFCSIAGSRFDSALAQSDLKRYRRRGPNPSTRLLRDLIQAEGGGKTVLDIGGGIGALSFELLGGGFLQGTIVDASAAYLTAARAEAERRGDAGRITLREADFVLAAPSTEHADVVTLDRVVCCYPLYEPLLSQAFSHSRRLLALSYPRDIWHIRLVVSVLNAMRALKRNPFRVFVHSAAGIHALAERQGFRRVKKTGTFVWAVELYTKSTET